MGGDVRVVTYGWWCVGVVCRGGGVYGWWCVGVMVCRGGGVVGVGVW